MISPVLAILGFVLGLGCPHGAPEWSVPACDDGNRINGYWTHGGESWVPGLIRLTSQFFETPIVMEGRAVWYADGLMEATARFRRLSLDGYVDGVAAMSCADIGQSYWIFHEDAWKGPFLVVDCPQLDDAYGVIVGRREVVEVGWQTARRWGTQPGGWRVLVSRVPPVDHLPEAVPLVDWYLERVEFYALALIVDLDNRPIYRNIDGVVSWRINGLWITYHPPMWEDPADTPLSTGTSTPGNATEASERCCFSKSTSVQLKEQSGGNTMDQLPTFVIGGVPLIVLVFALVEEVKAYGILEGKVLRLISLVLGLVFAAWFQVAQSGVPADASGWLTVVFVGLAYGLTASGAYDFLDARFPPIPD